MTPQEKHARSVEVAEQLLEHARIKRTAAGFAKGEQNILASKHLLNEAALVEVAANLLDGGHEARGWKTAV
jgi:hypothetical protein